MSPDYLRKQAKLLLQLSQSCMDLGASQKMRMMAADMLARAEESADEIPAYMAKGNGAAGGGIEPE